MSLKQRRKVTNYSDVARRHEVTMERLKRFKAELEEHRQSCADQLLSLQVKDRSRKRSGGRNENVGCEKGRREMISPPFIYSCFSCHFFLP